MFVVHVRIQVKPDMVEAFIAATRDNHVNTRTEAGNRRFDVLRSNADPNLFFLHEVYDSEEAFRLHQQQAYYFRWRDAVNPMMAVTRTAEKSTVLFPEPWA
jgi:autoinducer 2-degrading protein